MFRGFIAVEVKVPASIVELYGKIKALETSLKIVELQNLHLTLKFLGDTEEKHIGEMKKIIEKAVDGIAPFNIAFEGAGAFPNLNYMNVMWIGIKDSGILAKIAEKVDADAESLGYGRERRKFSPHLTIARVKDQKGKELLRKRIMEYENFKFGEQKVDAICLKKSTLTPNGPIYSTLEKIIIGN
ncbi:MAG: RNA 2',3'-cyclic phosphodiesterase [Thermoplasmata archaeon]